MAPKVLILVALLKFALCQESCSTERNTFPPGDVRNCPSLGKDPVCMMQSSQDSLRMMQQSSQVPVRMLEALPGIGFDNLRNIDRAQVHVYSFSSCKISNHGNFLLPDSVSLIPVQESKIETTAEYFSHWDNYTSGTARSINLEAGATFSATFPAISGRFSDEYAATKMRMFSDGADSTRVQVRHGLYNVVLRPEAQLHPVFVGRMYEIASHIQHNNTDYAKYLTEVTVREYGTHYTTSVLVGGVLSQSDFVRMVAESERRNIKEQASINFFEKLSLRDIFRYETSDTSARELLQSRTRSSFSTNGGIPFSQNLTLEAWTRGVVENPITIDRSGLPLHRAITPSSLPNMQSHTRNTLAWYLRQATERYYERNTRYGCTDPDSTNFNLNANLDDGTCEETPSRYRFGGTFQTCTPSSNSTENLCLTGDQPGRQPNPFTGNFSCPTGYTAINLQNGTITRTEQAQMCNEQCGACYTRSVALAQYQTYWCTVLGNDPLSIQNVTFTYLFGGYHATEDVNPVTDSMSCPRFYRPLYIGADVKLCVSNDSKPGNARAVDFGGFYSCMSGNPHAHVAPSVRNRAEWPRLCPIGYDRHSVTVQGACELTVCISSGAFSPETLLGPSLPPFMQDPIKNNNVTGLLPMFGAYGQVWVRSDDAAEGVWEAIDPQSPEGKDSILRYNLTQPLQACSSASRSTSSSMVPRGAVATISMIATIVMGLKIM